MNIISLLIFLGANPGVTVFLVFVLSLPLLAADLYTGRFLWQRGFRAPILVLAGSSLLSWLVQVGILASLALFDISYGPVWSLIAFYLFLILLAPLPVLFCWRLGGIFLTARHIERSPPRKWLCLATLFIYAITQLAAAGFTSYGYISEPLNLDVTQVHITMAKIPRGSKPLRLALISDIHMERFSRLDTAALNAITNNSPDIILLAGDYLNIDYTNDPASYAALAHFLQQLHAPLGVYAVQGTSDFLDRNPIHLMLVNAGIKVPQTKTLTTWTISAGQRKFLLQALDYDNPASDAAKLWNAPVDTTLPRILLYHTPDLADTATATGYDLYLCGHTHGGQITIPGYGAFYTNSFTGKRFISGLYALPSGETQLYVTRGIGFEGFSAPRMRLGARPEVTIITL